MTFSKSSQLALVSAVGLLIAILISACSEGTSDYIYVGSPAGINVFVEDSSTGVLSALSLQASGSVSPVAMVASADYANLYVLDKTSNSVLRFAINSDSSLSLKSDTAALPSNATPVSLAVNSTGTYLYVVYQTSAGAAQLAAYALSSGAIGSSAIDTHTLTLASYPSDTIVPTGVAVLPSNNAVYVTAYDSTNDTYGWAFGFWVASSTATTKTPTDVSCTTGFAVGSLCPFSSAFSAGVRPSAILPDLTGRFVYIADYASNQLIGYNIISDASSDGTTYAIKLSAMTYSSTTATGGYPKAMAIDPRGKYIYVANSLDSTVYAYSLNLSTGYLTGIVTSATSSNLTDTTPVAIAVDPAVGRFVLAANKDADTVSAFQLNVDTGAIAPVQTTHFSVNGAPTSIVAVPHGNHAVQAVAN
jgi:6-phosphogluconolactonase